MWKGESLDPPLTLPPLTPQSSSSPSSRPTTSGSGRAARSITRRGGGGHRGAQPRGRGPLALAAFADGDPARRALARRPLLRQSRATASVSGDAARPILPERGRSASPPPPGSRRGSPCSASVPGGDSAAAPWASAHLPRHLAQQPEGSFEFVGKERANCWPMLRPPLLDTSSLPLRLLTDPQLHVALEVGQRTRSRPRDHRARCLGSLVRWPREGERAPRARSRRPRQPRARPLRPPAAGWARRAPADRP
jgi:hypothetical protein